MEEVTLTSSRVPNAKDREKFKRFAEKQGLRRVIVRVGNGAEQKEYVIEVETKDADGRVLLNE